jgi:hypothetical protein
MNKIVQLPGTQPVNVGAQEILDGAKEEDLMTCLVVGEQRNGRLYLSSTQGLTLDNMWLLELAKRTLMDDHMGK